MALGLYCPYGYALKLMLWGLLWTHLELILDGYFKCVGCTCGLWAWMDRELKIMGLGLYEFHHLLTDSKSISFLPKNSVL